MNKIILLAISTLISLNVYSQNYNIKGVIQPNPIASSLKLYGDIPVSYSSGVPDIRIPLYTIQVGDFSLPIELRYHIRSVKPGSSITNVAPGWTLHFGGLVTRTAYGKPDEDSEHTTYGTEVGNGNDNLLKALAGDGGDYEMFDSEQDIFSYDINGNSGEFIISDDNFQTEFKQLGGQPIKIESYIDQNPFYPWMKPISGFKITNDNGVAFRFGFGSLESTQYGTNSVSTTFNLNSIVLPTNQTLTYTYTEPFSYYDETNSLHVNIKDMQQWAEFSEILEPTISICDLPSVTAYNNAYNTRQVWEKNIKTISFPNGKVEFIPSTDKRKITGIEIYEGGQIIKTYEFVFDQVYSMGGMGLLERVIEKDKDTVSIGEYQLEYNSKTTLTKNADTDYWGYYNGGNIYGSQVPYKQYTATDGQYLHPWCEPHSNFLPITTGVSKNSTGYAIVNVLKKIIYPTKGFTEFEYEPNEIVLNQTVVEGNGLRIGQIRNTDNNGHLNIRNFEYAPSTNGSITLYGDEFATTTYNVGIFRIGVWDYINPDSEEQVYKGGIGWYRQVDYSSVMGHRVMSTWEPRYQTVTESMGQNYDQGRNVYHFNFNVHDIDFGYNMYPLNYASVGPEFFVKNIKGWDDGNLIKQEIYDNNNSLLKKVEYSYNPVYEDTIQNTHVKKITNYIKHFSDTESDDSLRREALQIMVDFYYPFDNIELLPIYGFYNYNLITGRMEKTGEVETNYLNGSPVTKTITYNYNGVQKYYPSDITQTNSDGSLNKTRYKYPYDYEGYDTYDSMTVRNIIAYPVEQIDSLDNVFLKAEKTSFKKWHSSIFKPDTVFSKFAGQADYEPRLIYNNYDDRGNILSASKESDISQVYYWGYNKSLPVIEALNVDDSTLSIKVSEVQSNFEAFLTSLGNLETEAQRTAWEKFNISLRKKLPADAQIKTYTYRPLLGMTSQTDANGITAYYEYDTAGRLKCIKDDKGNILKTYEYNYKQE